jgi:hypothetical protein
MAGLVDKSLSFGIQNFFFVAQDSTGLVYDYVAYQDKKGAVLIARYKKDDSEGLYYIAVGVYAVIWAARAGFTYVLPGALVDPSI